MHLFFPVRNVPRAPVVIYAQKSDSVFGDMSQSKCHPAQIQLLISGALLQRKISQDSP